MDLNILVSGKICYRADPRNVKPPYALVFFSKKHEISEDLAVKIFGKEVSPIGVFITFSDDEKDEEFIRQTISCSFSHSPVIIDENAQIKDELGIDELPALVLLDEQGNIHNRITGFKRISEILNRREIAFSPKEIKSEREEKRWWYYGDEDEMFIDARRSDFSKFYFDTPGKIAYSRKTRLLAITDRGRKQVLVFSYGGYWDPFDIVGKEGGGDSPESEYEIDFEKTSFVNPSCVCFTESGRFLLIGDLFSNKIKVSDLLKRKILGFIRLPLPSHISRADGIFYVSSLTGKIFRLKIQEEKLKVIDYFDDITDNVIVDEINCTFGMPTAVIRTDDSRIVVVDAADSSVREIKDDGTIVTLAGGFKDGYVDGPLSIAQMNFPKSVETFRDVLFIADTLNNSIRIMIENRMSTIVLRNMELCRPEEIRIGAGILLVSDTGNKRVIEIEPIHMEGRILRITDEFV